MLESQGGFHLYGLEVQVHLRLGLQIIFVLKKLLVEFKFSKGFTSHKAGIKQLAK